MTRLMVSGTNRATHEFFIAHHLTLHRKHFYPTQLNAAPAQPQTLREDQPRLMHYAHGVIHGLSAAA